MLSERSPRGMVVGTHIVKPNTKYRPIYTLCVLEYF